MMIYKTIQIQRHFLLFPDLIHLMITLHPAWNQKLIQTPLYNTISQFNNSDIETLNSEPSPSKILQTSLSTSPLSSQNWTCFNSLLNIRCNTHIFPFNQWTFWQQQLCKYINVSWTWQFNHISATTTTPSNTNHSPTLLLNNIIKSIKPNPLFKLYPFTTPHLLIKFIIIQYKSSLPNLQNFFPRTPLPSHTGTAQKFVNHPLHANTNEFLQVCFPFYLQYTYFHSDPNEEHPNYVDEHVLEPALSWTSFYHYTNPHHYHFITPHMITNNATINSTI